MVTYVIPFKFNLYKVNEETDNLGQVDKSPEEQTILATLPKSLIESIVFVCWRFFLNPKYISIAACGRTLEDELKTFLDDIYKKLNLLDSENTEFLMFFGLIREKSFIALLKNVCKHKKYYETARPHDSRRCIQRPDFVPLIDDIIESCNKCKIDRKRNKPESKGQICNVIKKDCIDCRIKFIQHSFAHLNYQLHYGSAFTMNQVFAFTILCYVCVQSTSPQDGKAILNDGLESTGTSVILSYIHNWLSLIIEHAILLKAKKRINLESPFFNSCNKILQQELQNNNLNFNSVINYLLNVKSENNSKAVAPIQCLIGNNHDLITLTANSMFSSVLIHNIETNHRANEIFKLQSKTFFGAHSNQRVEIFYFLNITNDLTVEDKKILTEKLIAFANYLSHIRQDNRIVSEESFKSGLKALNFMDILSKLNKASLFNFKPQPTKIVVKKHVFKKS